MNSKTRFILVSIVLIATLIFSCDKNEEQNEIEELSGNWTWTATCGGFTGMCSYPDDDNFKSVHITNGRFIEKTNGVITIDAAYEITNTSTSESNTFEKNYELTLEDGRVIRMALIQNEKKLLI